VFATLEVKIELAFSALFAYNAKYLYNKEAKVMKQNELIKKMYEASLSQSKREMIELRKAELEHILAKRREGKSSFGPKWIVTDF